MSYYELVYVSMATRDLSALELTELLDQSRIKNARLQVTGLLIYHNMEFMQLLEGAEAEVCDLYRTICRDERNTQNYLIWDGSVEQRAFADWSMAFLTPDWLDLRDRPAYSRFLHDGLCQRARRLPRSTGKMFLLKMRDDLLRP